jgi:hypothetical protein
MTLTSTSVAIVNDDASYRDIWSLQVVEAGYQPYVVEPPKGRSFTSLPQLLKEVEHNARFAVIDHRLASRNFAQFTGAAAAAALYDRHKTAPVLVTTFEQIDADTTIRLYRSKVPVLVSAADFGISDSIDRWFAASAEETLDRRLPPERRPWRTIVQVEAISNEAGKNVVDAIVPGWNPDIRVRFPVELVRSSLRRYAKTGVAFFAMVNTGAYRQEDLFFTDFELAPEADVEDGLS